MEAFLQSLLLYTKVRNKQSVKTLNKIQNLPTILFFTNQIPYQQYYKKYNPTLMVNYSTKTLILSLSLLLTFASGQTDTTSDTTTTAAQLPHLNHAQVWGFGVLAGIGISAIGFVAALVLIVAKKCCNVVCFETLVKFLFSLSCGALVGDAVIHILAQAYASTETNSKIVSLIFILSIFSFMIVDRVLHAVGIAHSHWVGEKCEGDRENHGHHHHELSENNHKHQIKNEDMGENANKKCDHDHDHDHDHHHKHDHEHNHQHHNPQQNLKQKKLSGSQSSLADKSMPSSNVILQNIANNEEEQKQKKCCHSLAGKGSAGYINIVGSLIHNFIDGLALGVAFATANPSEIVPVLVAIIAHQIPRELGDVAILLRSSFTEVQTMLCNGIVNFISLIGVIIGLAVVNLSEMAKTYIMVFVAGNFIYIASDIWQHILKNKGEHSKRGNVLEFFGLSCGIGAMFALTLMEHSQKHQH